MTYAISIRQGNVRITCRLDYLTNGGPCQSIYCRKAQAAHLRASLGLNQLGLNQTKKQLYEPATLTELDHTTIYRNVLLDSQNLWIDSNRIIISLPEQEI